MANMTLFDDGRHRNIFLEDFGHGQMVQANQHLIVHDGDGLILDPGGHKVYPKVISETMALLGRGALRGVFFSHQDPDIVAAANGWLMTTDAIGWVSHLWLRFVPHFGLDSLVADRLRPIPDEGMRLDLNGGELLVLPAHFLHSPGNFQLYDPISRILYTGDLGASLGMAYTQVENFDAHLEFMTGFHRRYMGGRAAMQAWAAMVRELDIEIIAPQHGAVFCGRELVARFIDWCQNLECGVDLLPERFELPQ